MESMRLLALFVLLAGTGSAQLAFGPDGVLFWADAAGGSIVALETGDAAPNGAPQAVSVADLGVKIAGLLGTKPSEIRVEDLKVNPLSKNVYLHVSRGRGPDAIPVILRIAPDGTLTEVETEKLRQTRVTLPGTTQRRRLVVTALHYLDGRLIVAGLSNEEFSSTLRTIPYPFHSAGRGASVEIYHTSHFAYETNAPVRTMVPYRHGGEQFLLAAYTCTPLVKLRTADLVDGAHVTGETLAELGRHNSPLDMVLYRRDGEDFLLVANTANGVQKLSLGGFADFEAVDETGGNDAQIPLAKIPGLKAVTELDAYDATRAVVLFDVKGRLDLRTIPLP